MTQRAVGPFSLVTRLGRGEIGSLWLAADQAEAPAVLAIFEPAEAITIGLLAELGELTDHLSRAGQLSIRLRDLTGPTPWIAVGVRDWPAAASLFVARGRTFLLRPDVTHTVAAAMETERRHALDPLTAEMPLVAAEPPVVEAVEPVAIEPVAASEAPTPPALDLTSEPDDPTDPAELSSNVDETLTPTDPEPVPEPEPDPEPVPEPSRPGILVDLEAEADADDELDLTFVLNPPWPTHAQPRR